jgi:fructose-bisphosphate aldolase class I
MKNLKLIARQMVTTGKGILAADESTPTCTKRFQTHKIESTELTRNEYRSNLFSSKGLENFISGVILFDETFHQNLQGTNTPIPQYLKEKKILTGIKVDTGAKVLANHKSEKITEGLDGLRERLKLYKEKGADFAKWRAVITIGENIPSDACIYANSHGLARYYSLFQEAGLVPIVEPEVLMDGTHDIDKCFKTTESAIKIVFEQLKLLKVDLEGIVLKPNMVLPGNNTNNNVQESEITNATIDVLLKTVPKEVPGIAFLSGGQSSDLAAQRLHNLNYNNTSLPWKLTFSYGRALQEDALSSWASSRSKQDTQEALIKRVQMNSAASMGKLKDNFLK